MTRAELDTELERVRQLHEDWTRWAVSEGLLPTSLLRPSELTATSQEIAHERISQSQG
jgi:hypothetical protein